MTVNTLQTFEKQRVFGTRKTFVQNNATMRKHL